MRSSVVGLEVLKNEDAMSERGAKKNWKVDLEPLRQSLKEKTQESTPWVEDRWWHQSAMHVER